MKARLFLYPLFGALVFSLLGALVGWLIGTFMPDYYMSVFGLPGDSNTAMVGSGLGLSQGLIAGLVIGTAYAIFVGWSDAKQIVSEEARSPNPMPSRLGCWIAATGVLSAISLCFSLLGWAGDSLIRAASTPQVYWNGERIHFNYVGQRALVVTHLAVPAGEYGHYVIYSAAIEPPLVLMMKKDAEEVEVKKLRWVDSTGQQVDPPKSGDPITALYFVAEHASFGR